MLPISTFQCISADFVDDFFFPKSTSSVGIFPSVVQAYTQPYSFSGRIQLSITIHEISTSWKKTFDGGPYIYLLIFLYLFSFIFLWPIFYFISFVSFLLRTVRDRKKEKRKSLHHIIMNNRPKLKTKIKTKKTN